MYPCGARAYPRITRSDVDTHVASTGDKPTVVGRRASEAGVMRRCRGRRCNRGRCHGEALSLNACVRTVCRRRSRRRDFVHATSENGQCENLHCISARTSRSPHTCSGLCEYHASDFTCHSRRHPGAAAACTARRNSLCISGQPRRRPNSRVCLIPASSSTNFWRVPLLDLWPTWRLTAPCLANLGTSSLSSHSTPGTSKLIARYETHHEVHTTVGPAC